MIGSPLLTPDACARIERAVGRAEAGTAGEIVVMVAARAGQYRSIAHVAALVAGLILPWPLLVLTSWSTGAILLAQAALVAALLAAGLSEARDTVEEVVEPYLIQTGLVARTARGRMLNPAAWKHLGIVPPATMMQLPLLDDDVG